MVAIASHKKRGKKEVGMKTLMKVVVIGAAIFSLALTGIPCEAKGGGGGHQGGHGGGGGQHQNQGHQGGHGHGHDGGLSPRDLIPGVLPFRMLRALPRISVGGGSVCCISTGPDIVVHETVVIAPTPQVVMAMPQAVALPPQPMAPPPPMGVVEVSNRTPLTIEIHEAFSGGFGPVLFTLYAGGRNKIPIIQQRISLIATTPSGGVVAEGTFDFPVHGGAPVWSVTTWNIVQSETSGREETPQQRRCRRLTGVRPLYCRSVE